MGTVYRAQHLRLGRTVAVIVLPEALAAQPGFRTRFEREARALAMLNHPNIVGVHDIGQEGDQSYIVMEFVRGEPLSRLMPMSVDRAVAIVLQVCDALACAHRQGLVHRDIKPENVLIDAEGRVKVTDFGIAGAFVEIAMLFFFWVTVLKAWRVSRPLRRELPLWVGFFVGLVPPAITLLLQLRDWRP